ncbi:hypothetical protein GA0115240_14394 [Streptomyces sp. DvalAA-14]|uniref:hypothetical protein n=1 Tax=unclassified Streptomyces TaxID=2593676 RepID=UPI00081B59D9|nr:MULTISPECIES: hypothetical protein [unclassified Streptomyces]MYS22711.1 hypothetical protein [Streptomyces sp. SID4948]SCE21125.1 hypothetical protein GA0115240_14394 [Streptomyces sp. DvalAA-14]
MRTRTPAGPAATTAATTAATVAAATALLLLAGCGGVRVHPPSVPVGTTPACGDAVVTPGVTHRVCLGVGSTLRLSLAAGDQPGTERGAALAAVAPGVYRGTRVGSAQLSGFRHACPPATPGGFSCHAIVGWTVTVLVGGPVT